MLFVWTLVKSWSCVSSIAWLLINFTIVLLSFHALKSKECSYLHLSKLSTTKPFPSSCVPWTSGWPLSITWRLRWSPVGRQPVSKQLDWQRFANHFSWLATVILQQIRHCCCYICSDLWGSVWTPNASVSHFCVYFCPCRWWFLSQWTHSAADWYQTDSVLFPFFNPRPEGPKSADCRFSQIFKAAKATSSLHMCFPPFSPVWL